MSRQSFATLLLVAGLAMNAGCTRDDTILIGLAGPFAQERGTSMRRAAELAVREINGMGGIDGRLLELLVVDDNADADRAFRVAAQLHGNHRVVAVIGHLTSGTTLAAAPIYGGDDNPVVNISPSASSPQLSNAGPFTFRVCPTDQAHAARLAEWARSALGAQRAAILYRNDVYGRSVRTTFSSDFARLGGTVVTSDPYLDEIPSFEPYLRRLQQQGGADVLFIAGNQGDAGRILPALDTMGIRARVLGGDGLSGIQETVASAEGTYISSAYLPDRPGDRNERFISAYRTAYRNQLPDHRGAGSYDIVYLLAQAIDVVGSNRRRIRDYLAQVGRELAPFEGVTGTIAFDENGDVPSKKVVVGVVSNRRLITAPGQ